MKLFALVAAVSASTSWDGISVDNTCGQQISGENFVNKTCTIGGPNAIKSVFAGNGAFITGPNTFTGFDGISGDVDAVVFFNQEFENGVGDNSTCWDAAISCDDYGSAVEGVFFMETVNDDRQAKGANYNLQIAGVSPGDALSIDLNGFSCQNISAPFGEVYATPDAWGNQYSDDGTFSVQVGESFGDLFQISITQQPGQTSALNLWESSVSN